MLIVFWSCGYIHTIVINTGRQVYFCFHLIICRRLINLREVGIGKIALFAKIRIADANTLKNKVTTKRQCTQSYYS